MNQMEEALVKALGRETLNKAKAQAAKADPVNCEVCGDTITDEHDGSKCRELAREMKGKLR